MHANSINTFNFHQNLFIMKKMILTLIVFTCFMNLADAQDATEKKESPKKFMQVTTIESVVGGVALADLKW